MKMNITAAFAAALLGSSVAFAGPGEVLCVDELRADGNTFGGLDYALKKLNTKLAQIPSRDVSAPVFLSHAQPVIVCVTVNK